MEYTLGHRTEIIPFRQVFVKPYQALEVEALVWRSLKTTRIWMHFNLLLINARETVFEFKFPSKAF